MPDADLHFYFDPVCPFAWMTSKWVRLVMAERDYTVDWRFISLRQVNAEVDYDSHFPPQYEAGHTAGLRLLRVAAAARATHGRVCVGPLYAVMGKHLFETEWRTDGDDESGLDHRGTPSYVAPILAEVGLPQSLVEALYDDSWDMEIRAETDEALSLTGKDVGTPIIHFEPPDGVAFFGPVISRLPDREDAVAMWDHVLGLTRFPAFAELKRSLREVPQLRGLGVADGRVGAVEDWHAGHRRRQR
jgi:2-hydroxychromene-2-carboxylate isomerase